MRSCHALALAAGGLLLIAAAPAPAARPDDDDASSLTIDRIVEITDDQRVTLTGTYRCDPDLSPHPVRVSATLKKGETESGIGSSAATCDGHTHRWRIGAKPKGVTHQPGTARAEGALTQPSPAPDITRPRLLVVDDEDVTLVRAHR
jgi:hypothetical protein